MSSISSIQYAVNSSGASGALPLSAFTLDASRLYDGAAGDTGTGYSYTATATSLQLGILYDLGSTPDIASSMTLTGTLAGGGGGGGSLYASSDGVAWTSLGGGGFSGGTSTFSNAVPAGSRVAYRYYQLALSFGGGSSQTLTITDARLFTTAGMIAFSGSSGAATLSVRVASQGGLLTQTASRGPVTRAARRAVNGLFAQAAPSAAVSLPATAVAELLLSETATLLPRVLAPRTAFAGVLFSSAARSGRVAASGTTAPPIVSFEPALFSQTAVRGPVTRAVRRAVNALLPEKVAQPSLTFGTRRTVLSPLFTVAARGGVISRPPAPGAVDSRDPFTVMNTEIRFLLSLLGNSLGNAMSTSTVTLAVLDKIAASYRVNELTQLANTLAQLPTLIRGGDGISSTVYGFGADQPILTLLPAADSAIAQASPAAVLTGLYRGLMAAVAKFASDLGYSSLNAYLTALNTATPYSGLVHPNLALISYLYNSQNGTLLLSPGNVFAPQTLFGMATVGAGAALSYTDLSAIPAVNVVASGAGLSTQGYTGAKGVTANVTTAINGTLTVTLTASGQNAAGAAVTGRTWTATLSGLAAGGAVAFVPAIAGDRISDITAAGGAGTATAGAFNLNSVLERIVS